jgi:hypothetical protein
MSTHEARRPIVSNTTHWGPIGEPVHVDAAGPDDPVYNDNAFFAFWSLGENPIYGEAPVSVSPNGAGRRTRFTVVRGGIARRFPGGA